MYINELYGSFHLTFFYLTERYDKNVYLRLLSSINAPLAFLLACFVRKYCDSRIFSSIPLYIFRSLILCIYITFFLCILRVLLIDDNLYYWKYLLYRLNISLISVLLLILGKYKLILSYPYSAIRINFHESKTYMYHVSRTFIAECENQLKVFFLLKNIIVILRQFYKDTINICSSIFWNYVALIIVNRFLSSSVWFR